MSSAGHIDEVNCDLEISIYETNNILLDYECDMDEDQGPLSETHTANISNETSGANGEAANTESNNDIQCVFDSKIDEIEVVYMKTPNNVSKLCNDFRDNFSITTPPKQSPPSNEIELPDRQRKRNEQKKNEEPLKPALQLLEKPFYIRKLPWQPFPCRPNWNGPARTTKKMCSYPKYVCTKPYEPPTCELQEITIIESSIDYTTSSGDSGIESQIARKSIMIGRKRKLTKNKIFQKNLEIIANHITGNRKESKKGTNRVSKTVEYQTSGSSFSENEAQQIVKDIHRLNPLSDDKFKKHGSKRVVIE